MDVQSSGLLESASLQLNAIQEALKDAQGRQSEAIQKAKDIEQSYHQQIEELKNHNNRLKQEAEINLKEKKILSDENQEIKRDASDCKLLCESLNQNLLSKDNEILIIKQECESFRSCIIDKDKLIKRNESTFQQLITDITDSLTKSRMSNSELEERVSDYTARMQEQDDEAIRLKAEVLRYKSDCSRIEDALSEQTARHATEIGSLQTMLSEYSDSMAELKPMIEENQLIRQKLTTLGYKQELPWSIDELCADAEKYRAAEKAMRKKLAEAAAGAETYQAKLRKCDTQLAEMKGEMQLLNDIYGKEKAALTSLQLSMVQQQEDLTRIRQENLHMLEERKNIDHMRGVNDELNSYLQTQLEEKKRLEQRLASCEEALRDSDGKHAAANGHCWDISEELKHLKSLYDNECSLRQSLQGQLTSFISQQTCADTLIKNLTSSLQSSEINSRSEEDTRKQLVILQEEADSLREKIHSSTEEKKVLEANLQLNNRVREVERSEVSVAIRDLTDAVHGAKHRNEELSNALLEARSKLQSLAAENVMLEKKIHEHEASAESEEIRYNETVLDFQRRLRMEAEDREDLQVKISSAFNQIQIFQTQLKESQTKHWEAMESEKQLNNDLRRDLFTLNNNNNELSLKLETSTMESELSIANMQKEITTAISAAKSLRDELEKRIDELLEIRKERDILRAEKESFLLVSAEREKTIKRNEVAFQKALESDRAKLQQDFKTSISRLRNLESEKEEVLKENEQLSLQIMDLQQGISRVQEERDSYIKSSDMAANQCLELQSRLNDVIKELKDANRNEFALREEYSKSENTMKGEILKLEGMVKEAKKSAVAQVSQMSSQIRTNIEEMEALKRRHLDIIESERNFAAEIESTKMEIAFKNQQLDDFQNKFANEIVLLKAEIKDSKAHLNAINEEKSQLEMQVMESKQNLSKAECEIERWSQSFSEADERLRNADAEKEQIKDKLVKVIKSYNDLKVKFVNAEENCFKQAKIIEIMKEEFARAEREGLAEARVLRVTVSTLNIEISDVKSALDIQKRELEDSRASLCKLQATSAASINHLLEELKITEDTFAEFRKNSQNESNDLHLQIEQLNGKLEVSRENLDEIYLKTKTDKSERDLRVLTLENEMLRLKTIIASKEARLLELEKSLQENRSTIQKLRDTVIENERKSSEAESMLNMESLNRKRLEAKVLSLEAVTAEQLEPLLSRREISPMSNNLNLEKLSNQIKDNELPFPYSVEAFEFDLKLSSDERIDSAIKDEETHNPPAIRLQSSRSQPTLSAISSPESSKSTKKPSKGLVNEVRETVNFASRKLESSSTYVNSSNFEKNEYELSIERTHQFLRQRLAAGKRSISNDQSGKLEGNVSRTQSPIQLSANDGKSFPFADPLNIGADANGVSAAIHIDTPLLKPVSPINKI